MLQIAGKEPGAVKVKVWRELEGFDPLHDGEVDVEGTIAKIAMVYGIEPDTVAEELDLSDLLTCYIDCVKYVNGIVLEKLRNIPKNAEGGGSL